MHDRFCDQEMHLQYPVRFGSSGQSAYKSVNLFIRPILVVMIEEFCCIKYSLTLCINAVIAGANIAAIAETRAA